MNSQSFRFQDNSFDILRYFSAFSVMFLHYSYYGITLSGQGQNLFFLKLIRRFTEIFPGVIILFSLSGFLISASFERCKNRKEFFAKRVLRLYPELWLCTLVNLISIVILAKEYLDISIGVWLLTQIFGIANTPECLGKFATGSVNGALWTIFTEVQLYLFLGVAYPGLKKLKGVGWSILLTGSLVMNLLCQYIAENKNGIVSKMIERTFFPYLIWFLVGVLCYQKREEMIHILKKYVWILLMIFVLNQKLEVVTYGYYEDILTSLLLPFITIGAAYALPKVRMKCDLSYGIFLYHWIVINAMVHLRFFVRFPWYVCIIIFSGTVLLMACLSRYLVKKFFVL